MIYLEGIHLKATEADELHRIARKKFIISRSWYRVEDNCYDVICPITLENIQNYIDSIEERKFMNSIKP